VNGALAIECLHFCYHMQRGSGCTVLTATGLVNGEWEIILTPYRIETPEPIDIKSGTGDYVVCPGGEAKSRAKG